MKNKEPKTESITWGDCFRQLTNKELAEMFANTAACKHCPMRVECTGKCDQYMYYWRKYLGWLNKPMESEGEDE